jgi:hypothetical protein
MARVPSAAFAAPLLASLVLLSGCDAGQHPPVVTRDSAGVAIVFANRPAWADGEGWRIDPDARMVVGGLAGQRPYEFTSAGDARRLDDGKLLVTHCSNPPELRLYGANGGFLRALGGPGTGPGQCAFILHSWLAGDTVILYDPSLARVTRFPLDGGAPRVADLDAAGLGDVEHGAPVWTSRFSDGTLLGRPNTSPPVTDGRTRAPVTYVRLDLHGMALDTLLQVRGTEYVAAGLGTVAEDVRPVLFSPFTYAHAHGTLVYLADSEGFEVEERDTDGTLLRRFGRAWEPVPIDRAFRRSYREQRVDAAPANRRAAVRREMARAVFADHFPAHEGALLMDPTGHLWIGHVRTPGDTDHAWSVFDPDGRWLGEVHVPAQLRVTDIGADYVLGVWRDGRGVQTIRWFDLVKPDSA